MSDETNKVVSYPKARYTTNGYRYDRKATATMVEEMMFNPILATKVLLGIKVPPHEELRIIRMWSNYFTIDDSGFSTGKTFTNSIIAALRSILFPGRISGVISGTFRQGKFVFTNMEKFAANSKIFRNCMQTYQGKPRMTKGPDVWQIFFRGHSEIRILPPNFTGDAVRLKGERWNDGYFDEWNSFGNMGALTITLMGRVTANNPFPDCKVRSNHLHMTGTAGYTHDEAYRLVDTVNKHIQSGNKDYARFTINYRHVPRREEYKGLVDYKMIYSMQTMNPIGKVRSEIDGLWQKDSSSFYSSFSISKARSNLVKPLFQRLNDTDYYVAGFDTARGHSDSKRAEGDDFAMAIYRMPLHGQPYPCLVIRKNNVTAAQMSGIIHRVHRAFQLSMIVYDPGGGGLFVRDETSKSVQLIEGREVQAFPIIEYQDTSGIIGDRILVPFRRNAFQFKQAWGVMASDSVMINRMHMNMRAAIEAQYPMPLPTEWAGWNECETKGNVDIMRRFLQKQASLSSFERARAEMDLAIRQLMIVDVMRNSSGEPITDSFGMYRFKSKKYKDSAYALCYGQSAVMIFSHMKKLGMTNEFGGESGFAVHIGAV